MTEDKLNELIQELAQYILANFEKNPMLGKERDNCLIMAQEIGAKLYLEVLEKWKEKNRNGEKKENAR